MPRIAFIGAGSVVFTRNLLGDILRHPELRGSTIALHDIDAERLDTAERMARWTSDHLNASALIEAHAYRQDAISGADFVINMVQVGMHAATLLDFEIPAKYGLKQTIADSYGIGGIFRALRTIPVMQGVAQDIESLAPRALLLNYTNPMAMLTSSVYRDSSVRVVGLCHSVQYTVQQIAGYIGWDEQDIVFECSGVNHIAFFSRLEAKSSGEDLYPRLRLAAENPEIYAKDKVRFELFKWLGRFVTESSEHNAEYTPHFLRRDDQIDSFDVPVNEYLRRSENNLVQYAETRAKLLAGEGFEVKESVEYGAGIIHSIVTGQPRVIYGNVRNTGLIPNLPEGACVEVPVLVDAQGLRPTQCAPLEPQLLGQIMPHALVAELTVTAALYGERDALYQAAMLDRHASSVLSLSETRALVDELLAAHGQAMPEGLRTR